MVGPLCQHIDDLHVGVGYGVVDVGKEIGIFEIEKHSEIDHYAYNHQCFAATLTSSGSHAVESDAESPAEEGGEDEQQYEESRGLVVEKEADEEEVGIARKASSGGHGTAVANKAAFAFERQTYDTGVDSKNHEEESPKIELGEE